MKYVQPLGAAEDAPYVDANPAAGIEGSAVPAASLEHPQREIVAAILEAGLTPDPEDLTQLPQAILTMISDALSGFSAGIPVYASGAALPTEDIGPIWHADYASLMTWQVFNANGAAYTGYASVLVGSLLLDTQPTPRQGYVKSGVANLDRDVYAPLRHWAIHNGRAVNDAAWVAGEILVADNVDGITFRVYDVRGEFLRLWDDDRGIDTSRVFGSYQSDNYKSHTHSGGIAYTGSGKIDGYASSAPNEDNYSLATTGASGSTETRSRNTAFLAAIKF